MHSYGYIAKGLNSIGIYKSCKLVKVSIYCVINLKHFESLYFVSSK